MTTENYYILLCISCDVTISRYICRIKSRCPELLSNVALQSHLFAPIVPDPENNPASMARKYDVPYLGAIPMDPNVTIACEQGISFTDAFASSVAAPALTNIVQSVIGQLDAAGGAAEEDMDVSSASV